MPSARVVNVPTDEWPPRPVNEQFPPILTTVEVAQLLRLDAAPDSSPSKASRAVLDLVKYKGLPTLPRFCNGKRYRLPEVLQWVEQDHAAKDTLDAGAEVA